VVPSQMIPSAGVAGHVPVRPFQLFSQFVLYAHGITSQLRSRPLATTICFPPAC